MRIAEIFRSIQGEGRLTGTESIFVRTSGCNLRCRYCDTPYASWTPEGEDLSVAEILDRVDQLRRAEPPAVWLVFRQRQADQASAPGDVRHVVLTGGEPMLFAELIPLTAEPARRGLAHHDRNLRHALSAGGLRFDVDQPQAVQLHAVRRSGTRSGRGAHAPSARPGGDPPAAWPSTITN